MTAKFNIGDEITAIEKNRGFLEAKVIAIKDGVYTLKIPCGIATVLVPVVNSNYELKQ